MAKNLNIPPTSEDVIRKGWHKDRDGNSLLPNLSVEEAKRKMLEAKEVAVTHRGGIKVPKFIAESEASAVSVVPANEVQPTQPSRQVQPAPAARGVGGNVAVSDQASLLASANQKIDFLGIPRGARVNLREMVRAGAITQDEMNALLRNTGLVVNAPEVAEQPEPVAQVEPEEQALPEPQVVPERQPVPALQVVPEPQVVPDSEPQGKRVVSDDKLSKISYYKDGKDWILEIESKNGHGTQRFLATSKDDLIQKLGVAQANATKKIHDYKEEIEFGDRADTWDTVFNFMRDDLHISLEDYGKMPQQVKDLTIANIQAEQVRSFQSEYPNYYYTENNFKKISQYLEKREIPMTFHNLRLAWNKLTDDDMLDIRPEEATQEAPVVASVPVSVQPAAPVVANSTSAAVSTAAPASAAPAATAPAPVARKRGTTGIMPGSSAATQTVTEESTKPRILSEAELKAMDLKDLKRIAQQAWKPYRS